MSNRLSTRYPAQQSCCGSCACDKARDAPNPTVSVVIPTYNRSAVVLKAIRAVFRQTFQDFEIIVVDDGSDDGTCQRILALRDARITMLRHHENKGAAAARNTGVAAARGKYIAFLDSDDQWADDKLARQISFLEEGASQFRASCTGFDYMVRNLEQTEVRIPQHPLMYADFLLGCRCSPGSTLMVETALFTEVGPFNEDLLRLEDWDWLLRCAQITSIGVLQESLARIDARASGANQYAQVKRAAQMMMTAWCSGKSRPRSYRNRRLLLGTLWNEIAASAYLSGRYAAAVFSFVASMWFLPERRWRFYRRIAARLRHDIARSGPAVSMAGMSSTVRERDDLAKGQA